MEKRASEPVILVDMLVFKCQCNVETRSLTKITKRKSSNRAREDEKEQTRREMLIMSAKLKAFRSYLVFIVCILRNTKSVHAFKWMALIRAPHFSSTLSLLFSWCLFLCQNSIAEKFKYFFFFSRLPCLKFVFRGRKCCDKKRKHWEWANEISNQLYNIRFC